MSVALIVDDHPAVRLAVAAHLTQDLGFEVREATCAAEAIQAMKEVQPDLVIVDLDLPALPGDTVIEAVGNLCPSARLVVLSALTGAPIRALRAGAHGYVAKDSGLHELAEVLRVVLSGYAVFPVGSLDTLRRIADGPGSPTAGLSRREMTVLRFLATGQSNKSIAETLRISNKTVSSHKTSIMTKLKLSSLIELAEFARRHHLMG
ncbi:MULTISPECIES: LuxR C-terminal-related transcriptional regulator [unclassified Cupriavidus]|uniref:LuxR C-terminal-related transcriptional regulator n=1 Tax=Cupriavidus sp. H19C3 TaxID=3241603 RepID=UPI003BF8E878